MRIQVAKFNEAGDMSQRDMSLELTQVVQADF